MFQCIAVDEHVKPINWIFSDLLINHTMSDLHTPTDAMQLNIL